MCTDATTASATKTSGQKTTPSGHGMNSFVFYLKNSCLVIFQGLLICNYNQYLFSKLTHSIIMSCVDVKSICSKFQFILNLLLESIS